MKRQNRCDQNKDKRQAVQTNRFDPRDQLQSTLPALLPLFTRYLNKNEHKSSFCPELKRNYTFCSEEELAKLLTRTTEGNDCVTFDVW